MGALEFAGILVAFFFLFLAALFFLLSLWRRKHPPALARMAENPVLEPDPAHWWESEAVFNPGALYHGGLVHLVYRALGRDGVSRIGYARSPDGIHFKRLPYPIYTPERGVSISSPRCYGPLSYDTHTYGSGGGWGGAEDPRLVKIEERAYMTFGVFENWESMRLAVTSLGLGDLEAQVWKWAPYIAMSPEGQTHKNWVLFPEKIGGRFAILHTLTPEVRVEYVDSLEGLQENPIQSNNNRTGRVGAWDAFVRGAGAPPIKTPEGWLLFYHGMTPGDAVGYKVGAMLLDLENPTKILYRSNQPVLEPAEWYENDWKPGVVYASGAVVMGDELIVYYGGGDKHIAAAQANLDNFLYKLTHHQHAVLEPVTA